MKKTNRDKENLRNNITETENENHIAQHIDSNYKHKKTKYIICVVITVIVIFSILISMFYVHAYKCSDKYIFKQLDNRNVLSISSVYQRHYSKTQDLQEEFLEILYDYLFINISKFDNEEITYDVAKENYNIVQDVVEYNHMQGAMIGKYLNTLEGLKESKYAYQNGLTSFKEEEYDVAIGYFEDVISQDKNYSDAQNKIAESKSKLKEKTLVQADELIKSGKYADAIKVVEDVLKFCPNDTELTNKISEIKNVAVQNTISDAQNSFIDEGYQAAINTVDKAINEVGDSDTLNEEREKYQAYIPVALTDIECSERSKKHFSVRESGTDNTNNTHKNTIYVYHHGYGDDNQYEVYPLMGKYDTLTFEAFRNNHEKTKTSDETISINIYGDDILLKKITIDKNFMPQQDSLDISGVQKLKVEFESASTDASKWTDVLPGCIANMVVSKTK